MSKNKERQGTENPYLSHLIQPQVVVKRRRYFGTMLVLAIFFAAYPIPIVWSALQVANEFYFNFWNSKIEHSVFQIFGISVQPRTVILKDCAIVAIFWYVSLILFSKLLKPPIESVEVKPEIKGE